MIRRSDNTNVPRLIGLVGERRLARLAEAAGMGRFTLNMPFWGSSETTARGQARFFHRIDKLVPGRHRAYAMRLLATVVPSQRWGVGRVPQPGWRLYFKGGWSTGTGRVDHQVALYPAGDERFSLALFTQFDPDHEYGKKTLRGLAVRLLLGLPSPGRRLPRVARAALSRRYAVTAGDGCCRGDDPTGGRRGTDICDRRRVLRRLPPCTGRPAGPLVVAGGGRGTRCDRRVRIPWDD